MSARLIYDTAPLGSLIRFSNGEPQPPARFTRKLRAWTSDNGEGMLMERTPPIARGTYSFPGGFYLQLRDIGSGGVVMIRVRRQFSLSSALHFEIAERPAIGSVRVLVSHGERDELGHLAGDMAEAEAWMARNRYSTMRCEVVTGDDAVVLPRVQGRAA